MVALGFSLTERIAVTKKLEGFGGLIKSEKICSTVQNHA